MIGFNSRKVRVDSDLFGFCKIESIPSLEFILLKLEIVASDSKINFYTKCFCSTHFSKNIPKHKSLYLRINFTESIMSKSNPYQKKLCQNQFSSPLSQTYTNFKCVCILRSM
jgi:hypothetical protein